MWLTEMVSYPRPNIPSNLIAIRRKYPKSNRKSHLLAEGEGKTGLFGSFRKGLLLNQQVTEFQVVVGDKAFHGTGAILD